MMTTSTPFPRLRVILAQDALADEPGGARGVEHGALSGLGQHLHAREPAGPEQPRAGEPERAAPQRRAPGPGAPARSSSPRGDGPSRRSSTRIWPRHVSEPGSRIVSVARSPAARAAGLALGAAAQLGATRRPVLAGQQVQPGVVLIGDQDLRDVALEVVAQHDGAVGQRVGEVRERAHVGS